MKKYIIILLIIFNFPIIINANECDVKKVQANNIEYSYKYEMNKEIVEPVFTFTFKNIVGDLTIDLDNEYDYADKDKTKGSVLVDRESPEKQLIISSPNCGVLRTINVKLPYYNVNSDQEICEGLEEYKFCQPTLDKYYEPEVLYNAIKDVKKEIKIDSNDENNDNYEIYIYIIFIILLIINIVLVIIKVVRRKHEKSIL